MLSANLSAIFYLISGVLFILALRGLSSPETSRQGNFFGILGMIIAVTVTFLSIGNFSTGFVVVLIFLLIGGLFNPYHRHYCKRQTNKNKNPYHITSPANISLNSTEF